MTTKETIEGYFRALKEKNGWDSYFADPMIFTTFTAPVKEVSGKQAFLESTKRFYSTVASVQVRELMVAGDKGCALTRYELRPPKGPKFVSDVAELFTVKDGKIDRFDIYFDSAPFPK